MIVRNIVRLRANLWHIQAHSLQILITKNHWFFIAQLPDNNTTWQLNTKSPQATSNIKSRKSFSCIKRYQVVHKRWRCMFLKSVSHSRFRRDIDQRFRIIHAKDILEPWKYAQFNTESNWWYVFTPWHEYNVYGNTHIITECTPEGYPCRNGRYAFVGTKICSLAT